MGSILTFALQSGSNGNAIYVETPDARLLFDAGISGRQAAARMAVHRRDIRDCDAVIISHDHADHVRSAGIFSRKFGLPLLITARTLSATQWRVGQCRNVANFQSGETLRFGATTIETVATPHDAAEGCAFVVSHAGRRLGILTDLGHVFAGLEDVFAGLDAAYLESNYDSDMLRRGPYPDWLKSRISGDAGHLSNVDACELVERSGKRLRWLALAHLSEQNNTPEQALTTAKSLISRPMPVVVASRYSVSQCWEL